ncbi:hypothetical protein [Nocardia xishanensis]
MKTSHDWNVINDAVRAAEVRGDWGAAISVVSAAAKCCSADADMHNAHLWHMDLLVKAGRIDELATLAETPSTHGAGWTGFCTRTDAMVICGSGPSAGTRRRCTFS